MQILPVLIPFQSWLRYVAVALVITTITWPRLAIGHCLKHLKGKTYVNLPQDLCPHYTDLLLDRLNGQEEYSGVICDRPEASYLFLQRLMRYTNDGKAVWKIVQIQSINKPTSQSLVLSRGCQQTTASLPVPLFALVQPTADNTYQTLSAWQVNVTQESFIAVDPTDVRCKDVLP